MRVVSGIIGLAGLTAPLACVPSDGGVALTREERAWLDAHASETVLVLDPRWLPDRNIPDQRLYRGMIEDYVRLVERKLGVTFKRFEAESWEEVLAAEAQGQIDIHPVLFETPERSSTWLFTEPYFKIPMVVVAREAIKDEFSLEKMRESRMALGSGYGIDQFVETYCRGYNLVPVESDLFGLIKTSLGEVDVMIIDLASATSIIRQEGLTNLRLVAKLGSLYEFSFASRRDKPILHAVLKKAMAAIDPSERDAIYDRWIGFAPPPFYRSPVFWAWAGGAVAIASAVLLMVVIWNRELKRRVRLTTHDLVDELNRRRAAEAQLTEARDRLEERVRARTAELADTNAALQSEIAERRKVEAEILDVSNRERARIGRDLHDSLGQQLVGVSLLSKTMELRLQGKDPDTAAYAGKIVDMVEDSISKTRYIVQGLLPVDIVEDGLVLALRKLAQDTTETCGVNCAFTSRGSSLVRDNALALNIYHIVQEAVNNATKHAMASNIAITLDIGDGEATLEVRDDGRGLQAEIKDGGMGLKTMRYRAELAGGSLDVGSGPDKGTAVICRLRNRLLG